MSKYSEYSARASLMIIGLRMRALRIWQVVEQKVAIKQKAIRYRPLDKILDGFILMLAGGRGMVEVNTRVRPDQLLQSAFGRAGCAEQSTVSQTFNACTAQNVAKLREAVQTINQAHSQAYQHDYRQREQ